MHRMRPQVSPPGSPPIFNLPPVTRTIALLLLGVFGLLQFLPQQSANWVVAHMALVPSLLPSAVNHLSEPSAWVILMTPLTHALVHSDFMHFLVNTGMLLAFGGGVERLIGSRAMVMIIVFSTLGGAAAQVWADWGETIRVVGASGGISGLIGAMIRLLAADRRNSRNPRLAMTLLLMTLAFNGVFALLGSSFTGFGAIAWQAHLGGLAVGVLLTDGWVRRAAARTP